MITISGAYTERADEYADLLGTMAAVHPVDRQVVEVWAAGVHGHILDAGCGPGHWSGHLAQHGYEVRGIDFVPAFVDHARRAHPRVRFDAGTIDAIDAAAGSFGGVLSWFSTIHHSPETIAVPLAEFARVLGTGGRLALGFFTADAVEPFDHAVVTAYRWPVAELSRRVEHAGFEVVETHLRHTRGERSVGAILAVRTSR